MRDVLPPPTEVLSEVERENLSHRFAGISTIVFKHCGQITNNKIRLKLLVVSSSLSETCSSVLKQVDCYTHLGYIVPKYMYL